ncbi:hypothetical protein CTAYLR_010704 [Chrysophaeum taylorii]|uniref:non-specific serine/threonine protein kinase n=1 Tax=Chrysophaeum taylorii TaxID=2483200 RepID=A0AAD7XNR0_9STRA|nr:hypothetical protein CTAYLR_010704 [Chrysophaeum taylorii]
MTSATTRSRWTEIRLIGRGAQGTVHLVRGEDGTVRVAKRVDMVTMRERERAAAHRECGLLRTLNHPHIVKYVDSYEEASALVLVMEWCERGDFSRRIATTRDAGRIFPDREILRWFAQMADALKYMHSRRVLHRDLKSSNVFLTNNNDAMLGDLGIAKILESTMAEADSVVGTPQYLSPELCENRPYSYSSDVWALGCVLYELCALKRPFDASNLLGVVYCVVKADIDPIPISNRHAGLKALISKILVKDASMRPNIKDVLAETLRICSTLDVVSDATAKPDDDEDAYPDDFETYFDSDDDDADIKVHITSTREDHRLDKPRASLPSPPPRGGPATPVRPSAPPPPGGPVTPVRLAAPPSPGGTTTPVRFTARTPPPCCSSSSKERRPEKKSYDSVSGTTTPPRASDTSGFLMARASTTSSKKWLERHRARTSSSLMQPAANAGYSTADRRPSSGKEPKLIPWPSRLGIKKKDKPALPAQQPATASRSPSRTPLFARSAKRAESAAKRRLKQERPDDSGATDHSTYNEQFPCNRCSRRGESDVSSPRARSTNQKPPVHGTKTMSALRLAQRRTPMTKTTSRPCSFGSDTGFDDAAAPSALDSRDAAHLRAKLGDDAFFAICEVFRSAYDRGTIVNRRDLIEIIGTHGRYEDCLQIERLVFADHAAGC